MTADGLNTYAFNAESEIKTGANVNYTYDGDGNRVQKSNGKIYWYGAGTEILDETDLSGNVTSEYVYFGGRRVARRDSGGNIYYYMEDFLGSSRVITTAWGTVCYDADFYPYGGERAYTNTCPQNYKFEGKERDTETNIDDFGARYYSSSLGRWLSADWSAVPTPVPYANLTNPQTLNLYAMVRDNPETFADLDGHADGQDAVGTGCGCISDTNKTSVPAPPPEKDPAEAPKPPPPPQEKQGTIPGTSQPPALQPPKPPASASQKTEFSSVDAAGIAAVKGINPKSVSENLEYAGWIENNPNGTYSIDRAHRGTEAGSDPGPKPAAAAAEYHTHGGPSPGAESFSGRDVNSIRKWGVPGYLGTPSGRVITQPVVGKPRILVGPD